MRQPPTHMTTLPGLRRLSGCLDERVYVATGYSSAANLALDMQALARPPLPRECQLLVDTGCNLRCSHCFLGDKHPILDYAKLGELMAELPRGDAADTLLLRTLRARNRREPLIMTVWSNLSVGLPSTNANSCSPMGPHSMTMWFACCTSMALFAFTSR